MIISNPSVPPANNVTTLTAVNLKQVAAQLGLGATPSGWFSVLDALELAHGVSLCGNANTSGQLLFNAVQVGAATWYYKEAGYAARLYTDTAGNVYIDTAPSGAAGSPITFTNRLKVALDGTLTGGKAVTANYTRVAPNLQQWTSGSVGNTGLVSGANTIAAPAGAKFVELSLQANAVAAGTAAARWATIYQTASSGGAVIRRLLNAYALEPSGLGSGTTITTSYGTVLCPVTAGNIYLTVQFDTGGQSSCAYGIAGIGD